MNELYHTDLGVRVRKVGESPSGKFFYVDRIEDGRRLMLPAVELSRVILDENGLSRERKGGDVKVEEKLRLEAITFERGTVLPNEIGNLTGPTGELTKILQECAGKIEALGFKRPTAPWNVLAFGKQFQVQVGAHANV